MRGTESETCSYRQSEWKQAVTAYGEAAKAYHQAGNKRGEADVTSTVALVYMSQGKRDLAVEAWNQARNIYDKNAIQSAWADDVGRRIDQYTGSTKR